MTATAGFFMAKYGVALTLRVPLQDATTGEFLLTAAWTPATNDVKVVKDGVDGNIGTLPSGDDMGAGALWIFTLTAEEMQAAEVIILVADAAVAAVKDAAFVIHTYGNASAQHAVDLDDSVRAGLTALPNAVAEAAGGLFTRGTGAGQINQAANGMVDVSLVRWRNVVPLGTLIDGSLAANSFIRQSTAQVGAAGTITLDTSASAVDDFYSDTFITILSSTGVGQVRRITDYDGTTKVATITPNWITNPSGTSVFVIMMMARVSSELGAGSIVASTFGAGAIDAAAIAAGAIDADAIAAGAIGASELADGAITAAKFAAGAIDAAAIAANAIDADAIAADAITSAKIAAGAIDADSLAAGAITAAKIADGAVTAAKFAAGAIDAAAIADGAIDALAIAANALGASELAADAAQEIADLVSTEVAADNQGLGS